MRKFSNKIKLVLFITLLSCITLLSQNVYNKSVSLCISPSIDEVDFKAKIEEYYNIRSKALASGDLSTLKPMFDLSQKYGQWCLEHEVRRVKYLRDWSKKRNIKFTNIESSVRIRKTTPKGEKVRFYLEESYKFDYIYTTDSAPTVNSFGVGIRHSLTLVNKDNNWLIDRDWYTDCFEDAMGAYSGLITTESAILPNDTNNTFSHSNSSSLLKYGYNRAKAIEYADKYCGTAWGSGNNFKYNKKYNDYNGMGGDCTNFVSQVLSDKEGGGLKNDSAWFSGSHAWSNVDGLKDYILYSGKGYVIGKNTFERLTKPLDTLPNGIISKVKLGDLVCYVKKGDPDHFAVITGMDSHGYPLVNSHTTDRYHVPWDLGWGDNKITFVLIHING